MATFVVSPTTISEPYLSLSSPLIVNTSDDKRVTTISQPYFSVTSSPHIIVKKSKDERVTTISSPIMYSVSNNNKLDLSNIIVTDDNPVVVTTTDTIFSPSYIVSPDNRVLLTPTSLSTVTVGKRGTHNLSVDLTLSDPVLSSYYNLDNDPKIHKQLSKYFYYKILDKWLLDDLSSLLGFVSIKGKKIKLTKRHSSKRDSEKNIKKKIDFLEDKVFTYKDVMKILKRVVEEDDDIKWVDLYKKTNTLIDVFRYELEKLFIKRA